MWSFKSAQERKADKAAPVQDPEGAFVVPNYTRGSPYVIANPDFAPNPRVKHGEHPYRNVSTQQARSGFATYPLPDKPPGRWRGYRTESWVRSEKQEHVINGAEGFPNQQHHQYWKQNPYRLEANYVNRPQRTPHEYSFVRPFDKGILGARDLNGNHNSQATIGQSSEPFKGLSINHRRRSTYRLEPTQFNVATVDDNSGVVPMNMTFTSPSADYPERSYRLS